MVFLRWFFGFSIVFAFGSPSQASLFSKLKEGGYVVFLRHHATNRNQNDTQRDKVINCTTVQERTTQRMLSPEGRTGAEKIQKSLTRQKIRVGKVWSSPFCRCVDTAQLAFGRHVVSQALFFAMGLSPEGRVENTAALKELLSQIPEKGTNNFIVSHTANLKEAAGIWPKPEGVAMVFKPLGKGQFKFVGKIEPKDW